MFNGSGKDNIRPCGKKKDVQIFVSVISATKERKMIYQYVNSGSLWVVNNSYCTFIVYVFYHI